MRFRLISMVATMFISIQVYAEDAKQDPRVEEARLACSAADVTKGIHLLAELYTATQDPIWIFNQARCYQQNAQPSQALSRFKEYLWKSQGSPTEDIRDAQQHIAEIEQDLNRRSEPRTLDTANATSAQAVKDERSTEPSVPAASSKVLRYTGTGLLITGSAVLVTGVVFSWLVRKTEREIEEQVRLGIGTTDPGYSRYKENLANGRSYESMQWLAYGTGTAAVLLGGLLYWIGVRATNRSLISTKVAPLIVSHGGGALMQITY